MKVPTSTGEIVYTISEGEDMLITTMSFKESVDLGKNLFKDTFRSQGKYREETEKVKVSLSKRAWFLHSLLTISRIVHPALGFASW